jgi:hypothetical protein|tara:strand:+ start:11597 stop:12322 length:726 start_codon:yes stop_codon:yes gene_type:complete
MDTPPEGNSVNKSFITKVLDVDSETKAGLMNGMQYIMLAVIPVAIVDIVMKKIFVSTNPAHKGSVELLAEVLGQTVLTIILLFAVHKVIIAIPTYSGSAMNRLNYSTLSLALLISFFALNHQISGKIGVVFERLQDMWDGVQKEDKPQRKNSKVSVSQPISGTRQILPTHQGSRADNRQGQAAPTIQPVQQQQPPARQPAQEVDVTSQNNYSTSSENSLLGAQEPMAANQALGGGGNWTAW